MSIETYNNLVIGYINPETSDVESFECRVLAWEDLRYATAALRESLIGQVLADNPEDVRDEMRQLERIMDIIDLQPWVQTRERSI